MTWLELRDAINVALDNGTLDANANACVLDAYGSVLDEHVHLETYTETEDSAIVCDAYALQWSD